MSSLLYPSLGKSHPVPAKRVKVHGSGAIACLSNTLMVLKSPKPISFQKPVKSIAWHPTQLSIYAGNENGEVSLWNPMHFKEAAKSYKPHLSTVLSLDVSPNYDVASGSSDKTIKIYNSEMRYVTTLNAHTNWVRELQWRDPFTLISASDDHTIKIWDIRSKAHQSLEFKGHVTDMQIHSIDQVVGISHSSSVSLFDFRQLEMIQLYPLGYQPRGLSFNSSYMTVVGPYSYEVFNVQNGDIKFHVDVDEQIFDVEWKNNKAYFAMSKSLQEWTIPLEDYLNVNVNMSPLDFDLADPNAPNPVQKQKDLKAEIRKYSNKQRSPKRTAAIKTAKPVNRKPALPAKQTKPLTKRVTKVVANTEKKEADQQPEPEVQKLEVAVAKIQEVQQPQEKSVDVILLERSVDALTSQVEMLTRTVDVLLDRLQQVEGRFEEDDNY